ncbi:MAG TPA: hypothetical protein VI318_10700 [Baekduia sp.]
MTDTTTVANLPLNRDRPPAGSPEALPPAALGDLERRQRETAPPWGGALADGVEVVSVAPRSGGVRSGRSAADVERDTAAWAAALSAAGVSAGDACVTLLPPDGEGLGDVVRSGLARTGAQVREQRGDLPRLAIAEQRQHPARVLVASRTLALALHSTVYAEFPLEPADLGFDLIVIAGETATAGEVRRLDEEFEASVAQIATGPLGQPIGVARGSATFAAVDGARVACWDGAAYVIGAPGDLVVTLAGVEAMPIVNLAVGLRGTVAADGSFSFSGEPSPGVGRIAHRLVVDEALGRVMRLVPGVADWRLEIARPGREDVVTLRIHASRDDFDPIARNARRELAERLGLDVEVVVEPADAAAPYGNGIAAGDADAAG